MNWKFILPMFLIAVIGMGMWAYSWYEPLYEGTYHRGLAAIGPAFTIIGLGFLLMPVDLDSPYMKKARESGQNVPFEELPLKYKLLVGMRVVAGIGHAVFIDLYFGG